MADRRTVSRWFRSVLVLCLVFALGVPSLAPGVDFTEGDITGRVQNEQSEALAGIEVTLYTYVAGEEAGDGWWEAIDQRMTNSDGDFRFDDLPIDSYRLGCSDPNGVYADSFFDGAADLETADPIDLAESAFQYLQPVMKEWAHVTGSVTDESGDPLADIEVSVYAFDESWGGWSSIEKFAYTDADGAYDVGGLPAGTYRVQFWDPNDVYAPEFYDDVVDVHSATDVIVELGDTAENVDAQLIVGDHITGTVTDASGNPIADVQVIAYPWDEAQGFTEYPYHDAMTGPDGTYSIGGAAPGAYRIWFLDTNRVFLDEYYDDAEDIETASDVVVVSGSDTTGVDAELTEGGHVTGAVTGPSGQPLADVEVLAFSWRDEAWDVASMTNTLADGTYDIPGLESSSYRIGFRDSDQVYAIEYYDDQLSVSAAADVDVLAGDTTSDIDAQLAVGGTISGRVTNGNGDPIPGITVAAEPLEEFDGTQGYDVRMTTTDADGDYQITGLATLDYVVSFYDMDNFVYQGEYYDDAWSEEDVTAVPVVAGQAVTGIDAELAKNLEPVYIEGADRYRTAIEMSRQAFPDGANCVVVATATNWPDALGGAALAAAKDGPILLTMPSMLPAAVAEEIERLGATEAVVLGGESAVNGPVHDTLVDMMGAGNVSRIGGSSRYETAQLIAEAVVDEAGSEYDGTAFVATGANFPDALAASPLAAAQSWPLYLVPASGISAATQASMDDAGVTDVILLGGTAAVSSDIENALKSAHGASHVTRLEGLNRFDTAAIVAAYGVEHAGLSYNGLAIATGENFPDALAGGVLQGRAGSVMLLTRKAFLSAETAAVIEANTHVISEVRFLGGTGAVSQDVRDAVLAMLE